MKPNAAMSRLTLLLVLLLVLLVVFVVTPRVATCDDDGVVRVKGRTRPSALSAPLTPSLQCSACEVTAREMAAQAARRSVHDKYFGTDVELQEVIDAACDAGALARDYRLAQERFGARLKVFAKRNLAFDAQYTESPPLFYSEADEGRYVNAVHRLASFCQSFTDKFRDAHWKEHVRRRTAEAELKRAMCYENATQLCAPETLAPYAAVERRKRRRWKRSSPAARQVQLDRVQQELREVRRTQRDEAATQGSSSSSSDDAVDLESMTSL